MTNPADPRHADLFASIDDAIASERPVTDADHRCLRCVAAPLPDSDFCEGCRAFMLGDSPRDPAAAGRDELGGAPNGYRAAKLYTAIGRLIGRQPLLDGISEEELRVRFEDGRVLTGAAAVEYLSAEFGVN